MSKQRVLATKSRAVHTQGQATGTYSRGKITCSTHPGTSKKERKAGAKSRAVLTQGHVTGTYGRDKITCFTHTGTSKKKRKVGAKSRAVHTRTHCIQTWKVPSLRQEIKHRPFPHCCKHSRRHKLWT